MGKPIVATRVGGISESVVNGKTGLLVSPGNSEALGSAVLQLLQDSQKREEMGMASRRPVEVNFEFSKTMAQLEMVYRELAQRGKYI